jgi:glycosyltransferase involved in cell wall biosynthesis
VYRGLEVGAVVPARDEEGAVGLVVRDLRALRGERGGPLLEDVVVCDNGSVDRTAAIAREAGARVVLERRRGYGAACLAGLRTLRGVDVVLFVDADRSIVAEEGILLLDAIADGADLVVGSRTLGRTEPGSLPGHQRLGNRFAAFLIRRLWGYPATDLGPFRAIRRTAVERLEMRDPTYGWTVEMQVKAIQAGLRVVEVPVSLRRRIGVSKIGGTLRGTLGAAWKIVATIAFLRLQGGLGRAETPAGALRARGPSGA